MKRFYTLLILYLGIFSTLMAHDAVVDGIYYNLDTTNKTATVTFMGEDHKSYYGEYAGSITIPASFIHNSGIYRVISIDDWAFYNCDGLTSVDVPDSVTSIGNSAFSDCSGLTEVIIPTSVTSIGDKAFFDCNGLTSVTMGDNVASIGNNAFAGCKSLTSIIIPSSVISIREGTFSDCKGLKSVTIGDNVTSIGAKAFYNCIGLTSVIIPNSVTSISDSVFEGCVGLSSITIGNSVKFIGGHAFAGCDGLTSIILPNSVESIGDYVFASCDYLTAINIPNSVTSIGESAFNGCDALDSVIIGEKVSTIGYRAFYKCVSLTSITIPNSVESIGASAFQDCKNLASVTIGNNVSSIGSKAFYNCNNLKNISLYATTVPKSSTNSFSNYIAYLYVPCTAKQDYDIDATFGQFKYIECLTDEGDSEGGESGNDTENPETPDTPDIPDDDCVAYLTFYLDVDEDAEAKMEEIKNEFPLSAENIRLKQERDEEIRKVFTGESDKFIAVIGPCSADNEEAVLDYVERLAKVQEVIKDKVIIIPRVYTNKPRTTGKGYKGIRRGFPCKLRLHETHGSGHFETGSEQSRFGWSIRLCAERARQERGLIT